MPDAFTPTPRPQPHDRAPPTWSVTRWLPCSRWCCWWVRQSAVTSSVTPDTRSTSRHVGLALFALATGGFAIGTTEFVTMGLLPQIADGVHISIPTAGHLVSAYAIGVVVGAPVLAGLGAKFPRRTLLVALMVAFTLGNLLSALAPSYTTLMGA